MQKSLECLMLSFSIVKEKLRNFDDVKSCRWLHREKYEFAEIFTGHMGYTVEIIELLRYQIIRLGWNWLRTYKERTQNGKGVQRILLYWNQVNQPMIWVLYQ